MNEPVVRRRWSEGQSRNAHGRRPTVVQRLAGALLVMSSMSTLESVGQSTALLDGLGLWALTVSTAPFAWCSHLGMHAYSFRSCPHQDDLPRVLLQFTQKSLKPSPHESQPLSQVGSSRPYNGWVPATGPLRARRPPFFSGTDASLRSLPAKPRGFAALPKAHCVENAKLPVK